MFGNHMNDLILTLYLTKLITLLDFNQSVFVFNQLILKIKIVNSFECRLIKHI